MTGLVRKATLLTACGVFVAAAAMAGVPSAGNSTLPAPAFFTVVGQATGVPDPIGVFSIVVRDLGNNPINGSSVVLDFSAVGSSDLIAATDQLDATTYVNCTAKTVRRFTDITGSVTFNVVGFSNNAGASVGAGLDGVKVYADGVLIGTLTAAVVDQDGLNGCDGNDLSVWIADQGDGGYWGRSDYDYTGVVDGNDLSVWIGYQGIGQSAESGAYVCP